MYCMFPKVLTIVVIICMFFPEQITILNGMGVTGQIEGKVKIHSFILFLVLLIFFSAVCRLCGMCPSSLNHTKL